MEYQWALAMMAAPLFTFCHIHLASRHNFAGSTLCDITFLYSHFPDLTLAWWHEYNFQLAFSVPGMIFVFLISIASACQEAVNAANTIHPNPGLQPVHTSRVVSAFVESPVAYAAGITSVIVPPVCFSQGGNIH
ncbi:hypothetical protein ACM26M_19010 [Kluyvera cryocrescens]|uniref:hypothetical protein n=1 Tax=Kluyvera cryocrescens TaxID=580 RepID=UPI0039F6E9C2